MTYGTSGTLRFLRFHDIRWSLPTPDPFPDGRRRRQNLSGSRLGEEGERVGSTNKCNRFGFLFGLPSRREPNVVSPLPIPRLTRPPFPVYPITRVTHAKSSGLTGLGNQWLEVPSEGPTRTREVSWSQTPRLMPEPGQEMPVPICEEFRVHSPTALRDKRETRVL